MQFTSSSSADWKERGVGVDLPVWRQTVDTNGARGGGLARVSLSGCERRKEIPERCGKP